MISVDGVKFQCLDSYEMSTFIYHRRCVKSGYLVPVVEREFGVNINQTVIICFYITEFVLSSNKQTVYSDLHPSGSDPTV